MKPRNAFLATMKEIAALVDRLPQGAEVKVEWPDAPPDLVLLVSMQKGADLRTVEFGDGDSTNLAEWRCGGVVVRAELGSSSTTRKPVLRLVKPWML